MVFTYDSAKLPFVARINFSEFEFDYEMSEISRMKRHTTLILTCFCLVPFSVKKITGYCENVSCEIPFGGKPLRVAF